MNPFALVRRIAFELSNRCPLADRHTRCPAHLKRRDPPQNIPAGVVWSVLDGFKENVPGYSGLIYFHLYNEPLADPRLFDFVRLAARTLPHSTIQITTNGWNYDQTIHDELAAAGVKVVRFSIYSNEDLKRFRALKKNRIRTVIVPTTNPKFFAADPDSAWVHVLRQDIPDVYSPGPPSKIPGRCLAPFKQLCISSTGEVILCCMDWKRSVTFGNLVKNGGAIATVLNSPAMAEAYRNNSAGRRNFKVCERCVHRDK